MIEESYENVFKVQSKTEATMIDYDGTIQVRTRLTIKQVYSGQFRVLKSFTV